MNSHLVTLGHGSRGVLAAVVTLLLLLVPASNAWAGVSVSTDQTPRVNGTVFAIAQVGDLTVIGGNFTMVGGEPRESIAALRPDGSLDPNFLASTDGVVRALAGSADGTTVYVGGEFATVGDLPRANLAAVDATTGSTLAGWQADTTGTSPGVSALAVGGDRLFVGGSFRTIAGRHRPSLAALDPNSAAVRLAFHARVYGGGVRAVAVSPDGSKVYAGGVFTQIGQADRPYGSAELWAETGDATEFNPAVGGGNVITIGLAHDGSRLYVATANNSLFAYDLDSNTPTWITKTSGDTQAIAASSTEVYIGGHFSQVVTYKIKRSFLASLNPVDGTVTAWDPDLSGGIMGVWAIAMTPTALHIGGVFTSVGGVDRRRYARFPGTP